jgi:biopolymer transport protein TolQ
MNPPDYSAIHLILQAGPVGKAVLLILFVFSVISWAIIAEKFRMFLSARRESERFLKAFRAGVSYEELYRNFLGSSSVNPMFRLFREGYFRIQSTSLDRLGEDGLKTFEDAMDVAIAEEVSGLERRLSFLATTGSVSPFFGLLGTVWGVMDSFMRIGVTGTANLGTVAPGIAEALIATVAGLATAIPAVMAYNAFLRKIETIRRQMERFTFEFLATLPQRMGV